eukprot:gene9725-6813_t
MPYSIYIAGPAVFNPDFGAAYYDKVRALLKPHGVIPLIPIDNDVDVKDFLAIRNKNIEMIKKCDCIIADLSPFRSLEPDAGTAFEVGYAAALGKILLPFTTDTRSLVEKYNGPKDKDGLTVEDFSLPFNLMLSDGTKVFGSFEEAFQFFLDKHTTQYVSVVLKSFVVQSDKLMLLDALFMIKKTQWNDLSGMKLIPRGPITRLAAKELSTAAGAKVLPGLYSRQDWNEGRNLEQEEQRCGIALCLHNAAGANWSRPTAVVKAQPSDMHINQIDFNGDGSFLQKIPKGRWRKVSRQKTLLIENSSNEHFGDPDKSFSPRVQSYGEYVRRLGRVPETNPVLLFVMYREGIAMRSVFHRLHYEIGVKNDAIHVYEPPGGHLGSVTQFGYALGVSKELLPHASRHYNLFPLLFEPRRYMSLESFMDAQQAPPRGFFYRSLLRCVDVRDDEHLKDILQHVNSAGFINYFGVELFGIGGNTLFDISGLREKGYLDRAAGSYLQLLAESNPFHYDFFLSLINAHETTAAGVARLWSEKCKEAKLPKVECCLIEKVYDFYRASRSQDPQNALGALAALWEAIPNKTKLCDSTSQFVWNSMATRRLKESSTSVVKGDLVRSDTGILKVESDKDALNYSIHDVVLPVPYASCNVETLVFPETMTVSKAWAKEFAHQRGFLSIFNSAPTEGALRPPVYRRLIEKPIRLQAAVLRDPSSLASIKSDLFLKQERKSIDSFELSFDARVREPSPFNISEKLVARLEMIKRRCPGDKSVVLSFTLPPSTSPYIFLREAFNLRYASNGLLFVYSEATSLSPMLFLFALHGWRIYEQQQQQQRNMNSVRLSNMDHMRLAILHNVTYPHHIFGSGLLLLDDQSNELMLPGPQGEVHLSTQKTYSNVVVFCVASVPSVSAASNQNFIKVSGLLSREKAIIWAYNSCDQTEIYTETRSHRQKVPMMPRKNTEKRSSLWTERKKVSKKTPCASSAVAGASPSATTPFGGDVQQSKNRKEKMANDAVSWNALYWNTNGGQKKDYKLPQPKKKVTTSSNGTSVSKRPSKASKTSEKNKIKVLCHFFSVASAVRKGKESVLDALLRNLSVSKHSLWDDPLSRDTKNSFVGCIAEEKYLPLYMSQCWEEIALRTSEGLGNPDNDDDLLTGVAKKQKRFGAPKFSKFSNDPLWFSASKALHVFFPLNSMWESVSELINSRWRNILLQPLNSELLPRIILQEVFRCRIYGVPIWCSSHLEEEESTSRLYSIMHPMLRNTVTGHVIGFLDYYLKCYVNGGAYSETFIGEFQKRSEPIVQRDDVLDLQKELVEARRAYQEKGISMDNVSKYCLCLRDLLEEHLNEKELNINIFAGCCSSTFRLSGTVTKLLRGEGNIVEPLGFVDVVSESSVVSIESGVHGKNNKQELGVRERRIFSDAHKRMEQELQKNMPRHPYFAPYFELLKIIAFSAGLAETFLEVGTSLTWGSAESNSIGTDSVSLRPFPRVLPPLPIRRGCSCVISITFDKVANSVPDEECKQILNQMIRNEMDTISLEKRTDGVMATARQAARDAVKQQLPDANMNMVYSLDDRSLKTEVIASAFRRYLQDVICDALTAAVKDEMQRMLETVLDKQGMVEPPLLVSNYDDYCNLMSYATNYFSCWWMDSRVAEVNACYDDKRLDILRRFDVRDDSLPDLAAVAVERLDLEHEETLDFLEESVNRLIQQVEISANAMKADPLGYYVSLEREESALLHAGTVRCGYVDVMQSRDVILGSHGGCGLKDNRVPVENSRAVSERHRSYCNCEKEGKSAIHGAYEEQLYFHQEIPFRCFYGDFGAVQRTYRLKGPLEDSLMLRRCGAVASGIVPTENTDALDAFGLHVGHYVSTFPFSKETQQVFFRSCSKTLRSAPGTGGWLPIHCACASGNIAAVQCLLAAGVASDVVLPNKMYPLFIACSQNFSGIARLLLETNACHDVSRCSSMGETPLHWAVAYRNAPMVEDLLDHGALLRARPGDGVSPLHLAAHIGDLECLSVLVERFPENLFDTSTDDRIALHFACLRNNVQCAALLMERMTLAERQKALLRKDLRMATPFSLSLSLGHINLVLLLCEKAQTQDVNYLVRSSRERKRVEQIVSEIPLLASYFGRCTENTIKNVCGFTFEDVALSEFSKEKIIQRSPSSATRVSLLEECIRLRDPRFIKRVALYGSLNIGEVKQILVAVAEFGLHEWPQTLSSCGIDVCMDDIDGHLHNLLYLCARIEEDDALLKAVWKEFLRFTPLTTHYSHIVNVLAATPMKRFSTKRTIRAMLREVQAVPRLGDADKLLETSFTSAKKFTFARSLGLQPSREGIIRGSATCRPTVIRKILSEGYGLQEDVQLAMLKSSLMVDRIDNAYTILLVLWPTFQIRARDPSNYSEAVSLQELVNRYNFRCFQRSLEEQEKALSDRLMLQDVVASNVAFFKGLEARKFYPMKNGNFSVYSWLLTNGTKKYECPWDPSIEDEREMNGFDCACKRLCENPEEVKRVSASIGVPVQALLNHPSFLNSLEMLCDAPLIVLTRILNCCSDPPVIAACLSTLSLLKDCDGGIWDWLLKNVLSVSQELENLLDTVVSVDGVTLLMRLMPIPEAGSLIEIAFRSSKIVTALKMRDRYGRSTAHHLVRAASSPTPENNESINIRLSVVVKERLQYLISLYPPLLHQQDRYGQTIFMLLSMRNSTTCMYLLSSLAPVSVLDRFYTTEGYHALHVAAQYGSVKAAKMLILELGLNPNCRTTNTETTALHLTPLHVAARNGHTECFRLLLSLGADAMVRNNRDETPLHWVMENGSDDLFKCAQELPGFWLLTARGELVVPMSSNTSLSPYYRHRLLEVMHPNRALRSWRNQTPFLEAASRGGIISIHELAQAGADLLSFNTEKWNAMHFAAHRRNTAMLAQIIRYVTVLYSSAATQQLIVQRNCEGNSPIHLAAESGSEGCALLLLSFPCVRNICLGKKNHQGLTPSGVAVLAGNCNLAVILRDASSKNTENVCAAVDHKHELILRSFWSSVPSIADSHVHQKIMSIERISVENSTNATSLSKETEKLWEKATHEEGEQIAHLLSFEDSIVLYRHPAFHSRVVRAVVIHALADGCASAVSSLLSWCEKSCLPLHAITFCVEEVLLWEPVDHWARILDVFLFTLTVWPKKSYPIEDHVIWDWLRLFFHPKRVNDYYKLSFYDVLETFLGCLLGSKVNALPPPRMAFGTTETLYSVSAHKKLKAVTACLTNMNNEKEMCLALFHLNYVWAQSCAGISSLLVHGSHWRIIENILLHRFGARSLSSIHYIEENDKPLADDARSFLFQMMKDAENDTTSSVLLSWVSAASLAISVCGLPVTKRACETLYSRITFLEPSSGEPILMLPFLTSVAQSMVEIECEPVIMSCVERPHTEVVLFANEYMNGVRCAFNSCIESIRTTKLGKDRSADELISAFESLTNSKDNSETHRFSFDGSPTAACLSPTELEILRVVTIEMDACETTTLSSRFLNEVAEDTGGKMSSKPNAKLLGQLIAYIREGVYRTLNKRPFRVQCMCLAALMLPICMGKKSSFDFRGRLAQVATGEGKSIIVAMIAATFALMSQTVDIITSSRQLAARDAAEFRSFYHFWGFRVAHIAVEQPTKIHFNAEVVYGTNTDFEFVQLREGCMMKIIRQYDPMRTNCWVPRPQNVAIVDEADNLFLDAAQNSARIAYSTGVSFSWVYAPILELVADGNPRPSASAVRRKLCHAYSGYYAPMVDLLSDSQLTSWVQAANVALNHRTKDKDYVVRQQKVFIIDLDTGRLQESSRWSRGVHEMIEVKERVPVRMESGVIGSVAHPSFFDGYGTVIGITGTAGEPEEREEIRQLYGIECFDVPPHKPCLRQRFPTRVFPTSKGKQEAVVRSALAKSRSTSVLILVPTILESNQLVALVKKLAPPSPVCCLVLNETQREDEEFVLLKASQVGTILVATNTAGRGTDIRPSAEVLQNGGLHVIYGAFPPNLRVECQGLGRSARQGQPGSNQMFISLDEVLVKSLLGQSYYFCETNMEDCVKELYVARARQIKSISEYRNFFTDQRELSKTIFTMKNTKTVSILNAFTLSSSLPLKLSVEELLQRLRECFRLLWVIFYTQLSDKDDPELISHGSIVEPSTIEQQANTLYLKFLLRSQWPTLSAFLERSRESLLAVLETHQNILIQMEAMTETDAEDLSERKRIYIISYLCTTKGEIIMNSFSIAWDPFRQTEARAVLFTQILPFISCCWDTHNDCSYYLSLHRTIRVLFLWRTKHLVIMQQIPLGSHSFSNWSFGFYVLLSAVQPSWLICHLCVLQNQMLGYNDGGASLNTNKLAESNCLEDAKVGSILIPVFEEGETDHEKIAPGGTTELRKPALRAVEKERRYVYRSSAEGALYYLTRTRNRALVVDPTRIEYFPGGVEPEHLKGTIVDCRYSETEIEMIFSSSSDDDDDDPQKIGYIYVPGWSRHADAESRRDPINVAERTRRDVFCCRKKLNGLPYYLSFCGNPILVLDNRRIEFFRNGIEPDEGEIETMEEERDETVSIKENQESKEDEAVGTIRLRVPIGGLGARKMKTERRDVFRRQEEKNEDRTAGLYFVSRSGITVNLVDASKVHFYSEGIEELTSEEDLMDEIIRERKAANDESLRTGSAPSETPQERTPVRQSRHNFALNTLDLYEDELVNTLYPDDPLVGFIDIYITVPEQRSLAASDSENMTMHDKRESERFSDTLPVFIPQLGRKRCKLYASKDCDGRLYYLISLLNDEKMEQREDDEKLAIPSPPREADDTDVLVGSLEIHHTPREGEGGSVEVRDVYCSAKRSDSPLFSIAQTGNRIYVLDTKKVHLFEDHAELNRNSPEAEEIYDEIERVMGPEDGEDPKIGSLLVRVPKGNGGFRTDKEMRDVFCSLKFNHKPYYFTRTGNKVFVLEPERIQFHQKLPVKIKVKVSRQSKNNLDG